MSYVSRIGSALVDVRRETQGRIRGFVVCRALAQSRVEERTSGFRDTNGRQNSRDFSNEIDLPATSRLLEQPRQWVRTVATVPNCAAMTSGDLSSSNARSTRRSPAVSSYIAVSNAEGGVTSVCSPEIKAAIGCP
jgi:hypothetical protein